MIVDRLTSAVEQMAHSIIITNRDGIIEYVNPAFEAMAGFSRDDCVGRKTSVLRSGVQTPHFYETLWSTILSGRVFHMVVTNRRANGTLFDHEQTLTPIRDREGTITHFVSIGRDVTGRRSVRAARLQHRIEYERRRIADAVHADAGQFLALAHLTLADIARDVNPAVAERLQQVRQHLDEVEDRLRRAARGAQTGS